VSSEDHPNEHGPDDGRAAQPGEAPADPSELAEPGAAGEAARDARDEKSIDALEHGGLPVTARQRLAEMESAGGTWTSDLSVAELAAIRGLGLQPLGLVMGSSVYRVASQWGYQWAGQFGGGYQRVYPCPHMYRHDDMRTGYNWEHVQYGRGVQTARNLAMSRLEAEAHELGAHGVAGVRLTLKGLEQTGGLVEFTAIGTAVRRVGAPPLERPFTSHLSGQELAKLIGTGYVPTALVMGICAVEMDPGCGTEWRQGSFMNTEVPQLVDAAQACRHVAVEHLEQEASRSGDHVIGVEVSFDIHHLVGEAKLFEFRALGTAVRRFADTPMPTPPLVMLRLADKR
jgi:uncharacterized protein YbjQ (UPF0145 family)